MAITQSQLSRNAEFPPAAPIDARRQLCQSRAWMRAGRREAEQAFHLVDLEGEGDPLRRACADGR